MFDKFKDIFSKFKISNLSFKHRPVKKIVHEEGGPIYKTWLFILPVLCGLALGRLASIMLGFGLGAITSNAGVIDATVVGYSDRAATIENQRGLDGFLAANPFHISPVKIESDEVKVEQSDDVTVAEEPDTGLVDWVLRGTLPGIGAWVENKDKLNLILVGKEIERYTLSSVTYSEAVFKRGQNSVKKFITYGPLAEPAAKKEAPKKAAAPKPAPAPSNNSDNVVAAVPGGQEGEVSSETVNQLVQNPFDELKRVRIRPSEAAGGLEVQWIQNESILKKLGVRKGDVIRSVNGIPFTNMGDIANSINSLMNSERFDVEVTRGGKTEALRYVVR